LAEIELYELIENLRSELTKARRAGEGEELRFEIGQVELQLSVAVTKEAEASGGVKFWVLELGTDATATSAATQQMTLTLTPQLAGGGKALVSGEAARGEH